MSVLFPGQKGWSTEDNIWGVGDRPSDSELEGIRGRLRNSGNKIDSSNSNRKMSEVQYGGGFGRNRGGGGFGGPRRRSDGGQDFSAGTPWDSRNRDRGYGSGDIVQQELDRPQRAFEYVQRYPGGYGGQPMAGGGRGGRGPTGPQGPTGGGGFGGGDDNKFDRLIGALEKGWGGSSSSASTAPVSNTNTFNPVFNPTISMTGPNTQVAGGDIRESPISTETVTTGGGPTTAGRDANLSGGGDVDTGAGGGNNVVDAGPKSITEQVDTFTGTDTTPPPPVEQPPVVQPPVEQPPVVQPPVEQPPVVQPPVEQPPVVQPPVEQPPVVQPPVVQPPVVQPPVSQPPVEQQPNTIDPGLRDLLITNTLEQEATEDDPFKGQPKADLHANVLFQPGVGSGAGGFVGGDKDVFDYQFEGAVDISGMPGLSKVSAESEAFINELEPTVTDGLGAGGTQNANTTVNANTSASTGDNTMTAGGDIIGSTQDNSAIATGGLNIAGGNINQTGGGDISTVGGGGNVVNTNLGNLSGGQNLSATTDLNNTPETSAWDQLSDTEQFVATQYKNVFNRAPDEEGFKYWVDQLDAGDISEANTAASFVSSAEAKTKDEELGTYQGDTDTFLANYANDKAEEKTEESNSKSDYWDNYYAQNPEYAASIGIEGYDQADYFDYDPNDWSDPRNPFYVDPEVAAENAKLFQEAIKTGTPYKGSTL